MGGGGDDVGVGNGRRMGVAGDEAGEVGHVDHEKRADFVGDVAHAGEVELAGVGAAAADDNFWFFTEGDGFELVVVDGFCVAANLIADDAVELAGEVEFVAVGEVAAVGEVEAEDAVAGLEKGHVGGGVGLGAGVGLHVDVLGAEELFGAIAGEVFDDVGELTAAVVALAGVAFGVFIGENGACGLEDGATDEVFRRDHFETLVLAGDLVLDLLENFGVGSGEGSVEADRHEGILCLCGGWERQKQTRGARQFAAGAREEPRRTQRTPSVREGRKGGGGGLGGLGGEVFESGVDEGAEIPAVDELVGGFAGGVVAAGEDAGGVVDAVEIKGAEDVEGELADEGEVVRGVDDERAATGDGGKALHVGGGADKGEEAADLVLGEAGLLEGFADVAGGLAGPDDVAELSGGVVEGADFEAGIMGGGDEGVAGAKRGAEDAELLIALLLEPIEAGADVDDGLLAGGDRPADVGADGVVGAFDFGWTADVVVGLGEAKGGDAEAVEEGTEGVMGEGVGVPLGHDDDGLTGLAGLAGGGCGIPAGVDDVVFGVAGGDGGGEAEELGVGGVAGFGFALPLGVLGEGFGADVGGEKLGMSMFEAEVGRGGVGEEAFGVGSEVLIEGDHAIELGGWRVRVGG